MQRWHRTRLWATLGAVVLLLCTADPGSGEAESLGRRGSAIDPGVGKQVRLSLKISGAKKRKRQVSFYKSVARLAKQRTTGDRSLSSAR
jgi:hypothetical protein